MSLTISLESFTPLFLTNMRKRPFHENLTGLLEFEIDVMTYIQDQTKTHRVNHKNKIVPQLHCPNEFPSPTQLLILCSIISAKESFSSKKTTNT